MNSNLPLAGKKAVYFTLGCKLNFSETSTVASRLEALGVSRAGKGEIADLCYVNTCSVTEVADHKCRQAIHRLIKQHPGAFVVVTGCYAQLKPDVVKKIEGVDLVLGTAEKGRAVEMIVKGLSSSPSLVGRGADTPTTEEDNANTPLPSKEGMGGSPFVPSCSCGERTRYFLKVQDGCDYFCTYCTIPYARGFSRNPSISSLVKQAEQTAREGGKEIVLTGVNIGDFGKTTDDSFIDLLKALDDVEGIKRYRISSIEPDLLTDEIISFCAGSRSFMPHFHIPLQSGSDEVLRLMHRRYDSALFAHKINLIKEAMPDAFIGVDVMVGTRGETPERFEECYDLLERLDVTQLHVFPYSERPGTAALKIPYVVSDKDKKARSHRLLELSDRKTRSFYKRYIGTEAEVLFEKAARGRSMHGFTRNYIRVELPARLASDELDNQLVMVRLGDFNYDGSALRCEII
jgi:threonylcarbamoyladenosine tRNA methylthiotransferase MtaB